jgi:hypothetical protein
MARYRLYCIGDDAGGIGSAAWDEAAGIAMPLPKRTWADAKSSYFGVGVHVVPNESSWPLQVNEVKVNVPLLNSIATV